MHVSPLSSAELAKLLLFLLGQVRASTGWSKVRLIVQLPVEIAPRVFVSIYVPPVPSNIAVARTFIAVRALIGIVQSVLIHMSTNEKLWLWVHHGTCGLVEFGGRSAQNTAKRCR